MTTTFRTRIAQLAVVALALFAGSAAATGRAQDDHPRVALVIAGDAAEQPRIVADAKTAAARSGADVRVAHRSADQLGITHLLAARGYDAVVTLGVDRRIAIAPVAERYPQTRFVEADSNQLDRALSR
jgi:hypothetical protein